MNGELQTSSSGGGKCGACVPSCCPCFVPPMCSASRRGEYVKSLRSFSVLLGLLQVIMFVASVSVKGFVAPSENPMFGPPSSSLVLLGAKQCFLLQRRLQLFRFLTPILLHAGIIHLLMNMACQWRFALFVERQWGTPRFALVYLASGLGATLLSCVWSPNKVAVGASGALMGIMGAFLIDLALGWHNLRDLQQFQIYLLLAQTAAWSAVGLLLGFAPLVDGGAHFGGFLCGVASSFIANWHKPALKRNRLLAIIVPTLLLTIFAVTCIACFWTVIKCNAYP